MKVLFASMHSTVDDVHFVMVPKCVNVKSKSCTLTANELPC